MNLSNQEQSQLENTGSTDEFVRRLTISPLDTLWISTLDGSIEKRLIGYIDNHNTGIRRLDIIMLPGERIMLTRKEQRDVIAFTSRRIFQFNNKRVIEVDAAADMMFRKVNLDDSYRADLNKRLLDKLIGGDNLVHSQPLHRPLSIFLDDLAKVGIFNSFICYASDGKEVKVVKPCDWNDKWEKDDDNVYVLVPFSNITSIRILARDIVKLEQWVAESRINFEKDGITFKGDDPRYFSVVYSVPEQLFNLN